MSRGDFEFSAAKFSWKQRGNVVELLLENAGDTSQKMKRTNYAGQVA
jgi:hypothetical protein